MRCALLACLAIALWGGVASAELTGRYVEARNAAMWAGPCLVNSERGMLGDKAVLAWKVAKGDFEDARLDGLAVVALVFGDGTFGMGDKVTTKTIFVVDEKTSPAQQSALINMAKALAGETIQEVISVKRTKINMDVADDGSGYSFVDAGMAKIRTRRLRRSDNLCGTDQRRMVYPALAKISDEESAYTLENVYTVSRPEVDVRRYEDRNVPTAVIGNFSL